ncbi:PepSY-associated TM helix domain-containing protein [Chitinophaga japonensis]|uniref:Putative iron-regulated membrane protein n=1 Tax=Chitinophaga japonensis TaxID=104662 RepID=A0A562T378_CHIJA|nr:PepSY-associated TM helix domain-containing protein [Chitinophaga japonensis]TWI88039.1 putative iron-regulated membrane protein [Chitinophaga japonensis]
MKKIIGWLHLWLGLASGLVVLVVALTGSLLVFEKELEPLLSPRFHYVEAPAGEARPLSMDLLARKVLQRHQPYRLYDIDIEEAPDRSVIFTLQKSKDDRLAVAVNQYTGQIIQTVDEERRFFHVVLDLHRYLCMGTAGKVITGISCSIFLVLVLTGLVLWWPRRNSRRQRLRIKWNASWKRLNWDLHAVLGFYMHIILFLIALTGLTWSYQWMNNLIFYAFDGKPAVKITPPVATPATGHHYAYMDRMLATTDSILAYRGPVRIRFAEKPGQAVTVSRQNRDAAISNVTSFLYFREGSGQLVKTRLYEAESRGMKARRVVYPIHTGSLLGWPTKILALIASLIAASLPVTGLYIWLHRKKKTSRQKVHRQDRSPLLRKDSVSFPAGI